ncbi:MAG: LacI family DNA-binding transcriptional regulator [Planctomycetota bacterium]|nr:LacI family DNA-binding transcriptional regulator [Planctomycetota bacterium]
MSSACTIRDIAEAAQVSLETVSRVLNGKYKASTQRGRDRVAQVRAIAAKLGYRPDPAAVAMRTGRTRLVGIIVENDSVFCHSVLLEFLAGITETLEAAGYATALTRLHHQPFAQAGFSCQALDTRALDGAVVVDGLDLDLLQRLDLVLPALVLVNSPGWGNTPAVMRDEAAAGALAGGRLADAGYRRGIFLRKEPSAHPCYDQRWAGFAAGFAGPGRQAEECRLALPFDDDARAHLRSLAATDTVIVASDPLSALGLLDAFARMDLRIGIDVGLAALDEQSGMDYSSPGLARVSHDREAIGAAAAQLILARIDGQAVEPGTRRLVGSWRAGCTAPGPGG